MNKIREWFRGPPGQKGQRGPKGDPGKPGKCRCADDVVAIDASVKNLETRLDMWEKNLIAWKRKQKVEWPTAPHEDE